MQISAINSYSNINFGKRNKEQINNQTNQVQVVQQPRSKYAKLPVYAAMVVLPVIATGCEVRAHAHAEASFPVTNDTIIKRDTTVLPGDTVIRPDTIFMNDTIYQKPDTIIKNDTIINRDTVYIPPEFEFPQEIEDSLVTWLRNYLRVNIDGNGGYDNKALLYASGRRNWEYDRLETAKLNLKKSDAEEARYDHTLIDPKTQQTVKNDIRITRVKPGDITVVTKDGKTTNNISGLLLNVDGAKAFAHSNGRDRIYLYTRQMSGADAGKYVFKGTVEPGYLSKSNYGENILLKGMLSNESEDHYVQVKGNVIDAADLYSMEHEPSFEIE